MGWREEASKIRTGLDRGDFKKQRNYGKSFMEPFNRGIERQEAARIVEEREERARKAREEKEAADRQRALDKADAERQELVNLLAMRKNITLTPEINKKLMTTAKAGKLENINDLEQYYDDYLKYEAPRDVEVPLNQIEGTLPPEMRAREEAIRNRKNEILNLSKNIENVKKGNFTQEELNEFADEKSTTLVDSEGNPYDMPQADPASLQMQELGITKSDPELVFKDYQKDVLEMDLDEVKYALSQDGLTEERRLELERREKSFATDPTFKEVTYYLPDGSERKATTQEAKDSIEAEIKAIKEANKNLKEGEEPQPVWSTVKPPKAATFKNQDFYKLRPDGTYETFTATSATDLTDIQTENSVASEAGEALWTRVKPPTVKANPEDNWMTKDVTGQNAVGYMAIAKQALQKTIDPRGESSEPSAEEQKIRDRIAVIKKVIYSENDLMRPKDIEEAKRFLSIANSIGDADAIQLNNDFITSQQANIPPEITYEKWVKIEKVDGEDVGTIQRIQRTELGDGSVQFTYKDVDGTEVKVDSQSIDFRKLGEDELKEYMKLETARSSAIKIFQAKRTALAGTVGLASQMVDIVKGEEDVLNLGGSLAVGLESFKANLDGLQNIFERTFFVDTEGMSDEAKSALAKKQADTANYVLSKGINTNVDLSGNPSDESIAQAFGLNTSGVKDLAYKTALFTAKKYLLAFKLGGSLGTSGTAMSNADRERFENMIQPSTDPKAFIDNLKQIVEQSAFELNVDAQGFNNLEAGFNAMAAVNGYKLAYQSVSTWEEFYQSNEELEGYWNNVTGGTSNTEKTDETVKTTKPINEMTLEEKLKRKEEILKELGE